MYDPALGRWHVIDNKAEKYYSTNPYTYALNNPVIFIDPDGNEVIATNSASKQLVLQTASNMFGKNHGFSFSGNSLTSSGMPAGLSSGQQVVYKYFNDALVNSRSETTVKANQSYDFMTVGGDTKLVQVQGSAAATTFSTDKFNYQPDPNGITMPMDAQSTILVPQETVEGTTNLKTAGGDKQVGADHVLMHEFGHAIVNTIMNEFGGVFNGVDFNNMTEQQRSDWAIQYTNTLQNKSNQETGEGQHGRGTGQVPVDPLDPLKQ